MSRLPIHLFLSLAFVLTAANAWGAAPQGGVFIPRNGRLEACIGKGHIVFDTRSGGVLSPVGGAWPGVKPLGTLEAVAQVRGKAGQPPTELRQSFDASPQIDFLEEGSQRIGLRVRFRLYDRDSNYYGHGMTETWIYPDGNALVAAGLTLENMPEGATLTAARLEVDLPEGRSLLAPSSLRGGAAVAIGDKTLPGRFVLLGAPGAGAGNLAVYWRTGAMEHNDFINRSEKGAPTYYRWPDYLRQAYWGLPLKEAAFVPGKGEVSRADRLELRWPVTDGGKPAKPQDNFACVIRLAPVADEAAAKAFVEAERQPVKLTVTGGNIHGDLGGYNDQEGAYEVRKTAEPFSIALPADSTGRDISLKIIGLKGHGAVTAAVDGKSVIPQLSSDGGIADDPLAPIHEHPEAPADTAIVNVKLGAAPQTVTLREEDGVQFVYQCRDPGRHIAVYSTKTGGTYAGLRFSLADGHARNMRAYGHEDPALTENLFHWFSYCGYTPQQMLDQLRDFQVIKNGPDEAVFKYTSDNVDDTAQSQFLVRVPANAPGMTIDVNATFTVLTKWPYPSSQFFDVFPFRGVWPRDWWYDQTLWLSRDGRWKTRHTVTGKIEGDEKLETIAGGGFFALYNADRGNMLMLTKNFSPELPTNYVICGNYIDYHMDVQFAGADGKPAAPAKGFQTSVEYELMLWGDKSMSRDKLIDIGKKSIAAQKLVIPN